MRSHFITWMDRYNLEFPNQVKPDDADEHLQLLCKKGLEHEKLVLKQLKDQGKVVEIIQNDNDSEKTLSAMAEGANIYQARLDYVNQADNIRFSGYADFLIKVEGESSLGNWYYEPWDTKLALKTKPYFIIQLCCYAEMLEFIQGVRPQYFHIILGNREKRSFRTEDYFYFYEHIKRSFLQQQKDFTPEQQPEINGLEDYGRWTSHTEKILKEQDHLSRVANIRKTHIKNLRAAGISTLTQLAQTIKNHVSGISPNTLAKLKKQASAQLQSEAATIPFYEIILPQADDPRKGLALLPPPSINDVWFDIEGYPYVDGGLEYLFGIMYVNVDNTLCYKDWWSHNRQQEKESFQSFVHWIYDRWQNDPSLHIYHYAAYEPTALKRLMGRCGMCEEKIDNLLRNNVFVDAYTVVRQGVIIGTPTYSLKDVEKLYLDNPRSTAITKATVSIVYYAQWLEKQDGDTFENSTILRSIRDYNKDDIRSLKSLCDWLRQKQAESGISYIKTLTPTKENKSDDDASAPKNTIKSRAHELAQQLLASLEIKNKHVTPRLHSDICRFISNAVYEGRLTSHIHTDYRQIIVPKQNNDVITKESGVLFIPVEHYGNCHSSKEEVVVIENLVKNLLECSFKEDKTNQSTPPRPMTTEDILIVAPYNEQVYKIKKKLPHINVGSVDKFQGQEAPVIIISMCSSNADDATRGLAFLFSKNRFNVAISRAQVLAIVVGNPALADVSCNTVEQIKLTNLFCKIIKDGSSRRL